MIKLIYYFNGSTYAQDVLPFLEKEFPNTKFVQVPNESQPIQLHSWFVISPTPNNDALLFLMSLPLQAKIALLLDWNHQGFREDVEKLIQTGRIRIIFSPWKPDGFKKVKIIESLHGKMIRGKVKKQKLNDEDHFFCSQPLLEDRPELNFNQFDLLRMLLIKKKAGKIFVKRHPRETSPIPPDISTHQDIHLWEGSIEDALSVFKNWYGLNSMPLYDALALGHNVTFLSEDVS